MCRGLEAEENLDALKAKSQKSRLKTLMFPEKGHAAQKKELWNHGKIKLKR